MRLDWLVSLFYRRGHWLMRWWYRFTIWIGGLLPGDQLMPALNQHAISAAMAWGAQWRSDPLRGLFDYPTHPRRVQRRIKRGLMVGDCDDHAAYRAAVTRLAPGHWVDIWLLFIWYRRDDGKAGGHAVCVFRDLRDGQRWWADYVAPQVFTSPASCAQSRGRLICWAALQVVDLDKRQGLVFGHSVGGGPRSTF